MRGQNGSGRHDYLLAAEHLRPWLFSWVRELIAANSFQAEKDISEKKWQFLG
jgi:hypothetical protein